MKVGEGDPSHNSKKAHTQERIKMDRIFRILILRLSFLSLLIMMLLAVYLGGLFRHSSRASEHYKLLSRFSSYLFMCLIRQYLTTTRERYILSLCCCCCVSKNMNVRKSRAQAGDKNEGINTSIFHFSYILILLLRSHLSSERMFLRMYVPGFPLYQSAFIKNRRETPVESEKRQTTCTVYYSEVPNCWYKQPGNVSNLNLFSFLSNVLFIYDLLRFVRNINRI